VKERKRSEELECEIDIVFSKRLKGDFRID